MKSRFLSLVLAISVVAGLASCGGASKSNNTTTRTISSISLSPGYASVPLGLTQQFKVVANYANGATGDITTLVRWTSSAPAVATISNSAGSPGMATSVATGITNITASYQGLTTAPAQLTITSPALISIAVSPHTGAIALGTLQQFSATGTYTNGSTKVITTFVSWSSSTPAVATVGSSGVASSQSVGSATITATSGSISGTATLSVTPAALVSITVMPLSPTVPKGLSQQFAATGTYTDGTSQNLTSSVQWKSSNPSIVTVNSLGDGFAVSSGNAQVIATAAATGIFGQSTITVSPAALASIAVTPPNSSGALGTAQQFAATGTYTDGSTQDLTASALWRSSNTTVATIGASGQASTKAAGLTTISATSGSIVGSTNWTVTQATLVSIAVTPAIPSLPLGETQQFTATGTFTDGSIQDITNTVKWSSSDSTAATISMTSPTRGLAQALATGATVITASLSGISGNTTLTVSPAVIVSIAVAPSPLSFAKGTTQQLSAVATYSDNSTKDITNTATWSSANDTIASVSTSGAATAVKVGTTTITAASSGVTGAISVQVTPAVLASIAISPSSVSIPMGTTQQFTATGTYSDGSTQDLTASVQWTSSDATVATISMATSTIGLATSVGTGTATISANSGSVSGTASLTITPAALVSVAITPSAPSIALGQSQQFTATGTYTDNSTRDITTNVTWSTSNALVAVISNNIGSNGLATSSGQGTATMTARMGPVSATANLTVVALSAPTGVSATPAPSQITLNWNSVPGATGYNVSRSATSGGPFAPLATTTIPPYVDSGLAAGATYYYVVSATNSLTQSANSAEVSATTPVPTLVSISVSPGNPTVALGLTQQFTATALYSDGSTQDVTSSVTWSSSNATVAVVSTNGLASSLSQGSTVITAVASGGQVASTTLTVNAPGLVSITVTPTSATVSVGSYVRFSATGKYTNGTSLNISNLVNWSTSDTTISSVDSTGLAHTAGAGTVTITATSGSVQGTATLTVAAGTGGGSSPRFVYVANAGDSTVSGYLLDQGVGALTAVPGSPFSASEAYTVATDPTGQHVYTSGNYGVSGFSTDAVTGQLTAIAGSVPAFGNPNYNCCSQVYALAVDATGRFLYAADAYNNSLRAYTVDAGNGALTPIAGSPFAVGNNALPYSVTIDPTGKFVYVGNEGNNTISAFSIDAQSGTLTAVSGSPFAASSGVIALAMHASGKFLYAGNGTQVQGYAIDGTTGALTAMTGSPFATGCCMRFNSLATEPTGHYLFTANENAGTVSVFAIDAMSGALTAVTGSPFAVGGNPFAVTADVSGQFLYVTDVSTNPGVVKAYTISSSTGR